MDNTHGSPGLHELQEYRHERDPDLLYSIEHNLTFFWIRLRGQTIAAAKFRLIDGKRPGYDFTHEKAIEVIRGLYANAPPKHDPELHLAFSVHEEFWRHLRSGRQISEFAAHSSPSENNLG